MPKDDDDDEDDDGELVTVMILWYFLDTYKKDQQTKWNVHPKKNKRNKKMLIFTIKSTIMMDGLLVCKSYFHFLSHDFVGNSIEKK